VRQVMRMRRILLALSVAMVVAIWGGTALSPAAAEGPAGILLSRLTLAADRGDSRAITALRDLKDFAIRNGIDLARITSRAVADTRHAPRGTLSARGLAPFWIDVYQEVPFDGVHSIDDYVLERRAVAASLSEGISFAGLLSMNGFVPLERLCQLRRETNASIDDAAVDVWIGEAWVSRFGFGPGKPDFWNRPCAAVIADIRALLAQAHVGDMLEGNIEHARFTVGTAHLSAQSAGIALLHRQPDVLLFDPEVDLLAPWSASAAHVRLVTPVNAFMTLINARVAAGELENPFIPMDLSNKAIKP